MNCLQPTASFRLFCVRHAVYHMCLAELWDEVYQLISNVDWLLARAEMDPLGIVVDLEFAASFAASSYQTTIRLMGQALRMDVEELRSDHRTLPGRLVGRLMGHESEEMRELMSELKNWSGPPQGWSCTLNRQSRSQAATRSAIVGGVRCSHRLPLLADLC